MDEEILAEIIEILNRIRPDIIVDIGKDTCLGDSLDSFDLIILVTEIESRFKIKVPGEKITPENFERLELVVSLICSLRA